MAAGWVVGADADATVVAGGDIALGRLDALPEPAQPESVVADPTMSASASKTTARHRPKPDSTPTYLKTPESAIRFHETSSRKPGTRAAPDMLVTMAGIEADQLLEQ